MLRNAHPAQNENGVNLKMQSNKKLLGFEWNLE